MSAVGKTGNFNKQHTLQWFQVVSLVVYANSCGASNAIQHDKININHKSLEQKDWACSYKEKGKKKAPTKVQRTWKHFKLTDKGQRQFLKVPYYCINKSKILEVNYKLLPLYYKTIWGGEDHPISQTASERLVSVKNNNQILFSYCTWKSF